MNTRRAHLLDLYSDYLIASFGQTSATGMAHLIDDLSHDQITRFLAGKAFDNKDLWKIVKPHLRQIQDQDAVLIFDDTIEPKPYSDESEIICWYFDHTVRRNVKGINLLSALYYSQGVSLPVSLHFVQKTERGIDNKEKWESPVSKNDVLRQMITSAVSRQIPFRYVLADSWFSSDENLEFIKLKAKKDFILALKDNRNLYFEAASANKRNAIKISELDFTTETMPAVWLEGICFPVHICRQVFLHEDGSEAILYLCTSDLTLSASDMSMVYQKRWKVEEYHKRLKSNASFAKSPARRVGSQCNHLNHLFASVIAFVKLENCRVGSGLNHFAQKAKLYLTALRSAFKQFQQFQGNGTAFAIML